MNISLGIANNGDETKSGKGELYTSIATESEYGALYQFHGRVQGYNTLAKAFLTQGKLEEINAIEGETVLKGDILARLYSPGLMESLAAADALVNKAKANFDLWKSEQERGAILVKRNVMAKQRFSEIQNSYQVSVFELKQAESSRRQVQEEVQGLVVVAPEDGIITHINKEEGEYLGAGEALLRFESTERQKSVFDVPENVAVGITRGQTHNIFIPSIQQLIPAVVSEISRPSTDNLPLHRITFELEQPNPNITGLRTVLIIRTKPVPVYKVDYRAIRYDVDNNSFVFKKNSQGVLESLPVEPVDLQEGHVVVKAKSSIAGEVVVGSDATLPLSIQRVKEK